MSALGLIYGGLLGGVFASIGSMLAGILAYGLSRMLGRGIAVKIAGKQGIDQGEQLFASQAGGWMIRLSRWMLLLSAGLPPIIWLLLRPVFFNNKRV